MNAKSITVAALIGMIAAAALLFAYPAMASSMTVLQSNRVSQTANVQGRDLEGAHLSVGQTITLTSVAGGFKEVGTPSVNGTAGGSLSLRVIGAFTGGYALALTGGSLTLSETAYSVGTGSAELGPYGARMAGQGQTGASQILFTFRTLDRFGGPPYGVLGVDLLNGSREFAIRLLVTISR
jgi:hypothetical protein